MSRKMKDSGVEWLGKVPKDWNNIKFKYLLKKRKKILRNYLNEDVLSLTMKGVIKRDLENPKGKMPASFDGYQMVYEDNLLLCLFDIDVTPRCVGIINDKGITSPAYSQYEVVDNNDNKYLYYQLLLLDFDKVLVSYTKSLRNTLTDSDFGALVTVRPRYKEQVRIASFLDKKMLEINNIVDKTKQSIEELKAYKQSLITETVTKGLNPDAPMKDSGIEWIGEVPKHWDVVSLSMVSNSYSGGTPKRNVERYWNNGTIPWISSGEVNKEIINDSNELITEEGLNESSAKLFPPRTVLVALNGQGKTKGMSALLEIEASTNQSLVGFIPSNNLNYKYLHYTFIAAYSFNRSYYAGGEKRDGIAAGNLKKRKIPFPSLDVQLSIVKYIEEKIYNVEKLIENKNKLINELEIYKQSLIYEYVTGKKEVE